MATSSSSSKEQSSMDPRKGFSAIGGTITFDGKRGKKTANNFLAAVNVFRTGENMADTAALSQLPFILHGPAKAWWEEIKDSVSTWADFEKKFRAEFAVEATKTPQSVYERIFVKQEWDETIEDFVSERQGLFATLPDYFTEKQRLDMVFGLLTDKITSRVSREEVSSFEELIEKVKLALAETEDDLEECEGCGKLYDEDDFGDTNYGYRPSGQMPTCPDCRSYEHEAPMGF